MGFLNWIKKIGKHGKIRTSGRETKTPPVFRDRVISSANISRLILDSITREMAQLKNPKFAPFGVSRETHAAHLEFAEKQVDAICSATTYADMDVCSAALKSQDMDSWGMNRGILLTLATLLKVKETELFG